MNARISANGKHFVVGCPKCSNEILQPLAWTDQKYVLSCACGWELPVDDPDSQECARAIKEAEKLSESATIQAESPSAAEVAKQLEANPDAFAKLVERIRAARRRDEG